MHRDLLNKAVKKELCSFAGLATDLHFFSKPVLNSRPRDIHIITSIIIVIMFAFSQERVTPKCGRLVAFSAGEENLHGVLALTKGRRCAVALWFTLDPNHKESSFPIAEDILHQIKTVA